MTSLPASNALAAAAEPVATPRYQEKRESVLAAAAVLFNERGVKGARLSEIAASVGLATNSVTYYYRRKEDLATACFLKSIAAFDALALAASQPQDVPQRLTVFFSRLAGLLSDIELGRHPPIVTFNDIRALPPQHAQVVFAAYTDMFRHVRGLLKSDQTTHLGRDDLNARGHIVLSVAHCLRGWISRHEIEEYACVAGRLSGVLIHGVGSPGSIWQTTASESSWRLGSDDEGALEAFLRAATVLVNEQGYRGASVDKISARINVTKGSFYHHNDNKHDLISECFERSFGVVRQALSLAACGPGSGWTRACAAARSLVRYQLSDEGPLLRATATSALPDEQRREQVRRTMQRLTERMSSVMVDGMVDGSMRPHDPAVSAQCAIACINAAAELRRWVKRADVDNLADLYARPVFEGVLCPGIAG